VILPASAAGTLTLSNDADTQVTPLTFPAAAPFALLPSTLAGGSVTGAYAFTAGPTDVLHVEATSRAERGGARVQVTFTFTTAQDALYTFSATANGPTGFLGSLDGVTAVRNQTPPDFGNIPPAGTLLLSGFLTRSTPSRPPAPTPRSSRSASSTSPSPSPPPATAPSPSPPPPGWPCRPPPSPPAPGGSGGGGRMRAEGRSKRQRQY
jgi:hypothetical protein